MNVAALQWLDQDWDKATGPIRSQMDAAERRGFLMELRQSCEYMESCLQIGYWHTGGLERTRLKIVQMNEAIQAIENHLSLWDVHES
jgi:hypothetical protein